MEVLLLNGSGVPLAYTYTDANGNYQFANLPFGNYKVYAESPGIYNSTVPTVTLNSGTPSVSGVSISMNKTAQVAGISKGVTKQFSFYPNPVKDILKIDFIQKANGIELFSEDGKKIMNAENCISGELNLSNVEKGIYYLKVTDADGSLSFEKVIKE